MLKFVIQAQKLLEGNRKRIKFRKHSYVLHFQFYAKIITIALQKSIVTKDKTYSLITLKYF